MDPLCQKNCAISATTKLLSKNITLQSIIFHWKNEVKFVAINAWKNGVWKKKDYEINEKKGCKL
jgi:hypothetical protein